MADITDKVATARAYGYSDDEIVNYLASSGDMSAKIKKAQGAGYSSTDIVNHFISKTPAAQGPADATQIEKNPAWAQRGRTLYKAMNGPEFQGSDSEAAKWLGDFMYDFNNRLIGVGADGGRGTVDIAASLGSMTPEAKKAFVDAQNDYENMGYSWKGAGKVAFRIATDPTTYLGLGVGKLLSKGVEEAGKEGVVALAKRGAVQGIKEGATVGAGEGAAYGTATDAAHQVGMINADGQKYYDPLQTAKAAGIGALGGGAIGGATGAVTGAIAGRNPAVQAARRIVDNPEEAKMGAEITQRLSDIQATRDAPIQLSDVNQSADLLRSGIVRDLKKIDMPSEDLQKLTEGLTKAKAITQDQIDQLAQLPGGQQVADNIALLKQMRDMSQPVASDKGVIKKGLRTALDYAPIPKVVADAIKYAMFSPRKTGEEVIANAISPKNLAIAQKITDLAGPSQAAMSRDSLTAMARASMTAQKAQMEAAKFKSLQASYAKKQRALDAVRRNDPAVPDSPQGVMEDATGMNRSGVAQALRIIEKTRPALQGQVDQYRQSVATGGRIEDLSALIRAVRKLGDQNVVARVREPNSGSQVMQRGIGMSPMYSPAMAQANANQARVTASADRVAKSSLKEGDKQSIMATIAKIGMSNNRQDAIAAQMELLQGLSGEAKKQAIRETSALIEQIRHRTPDQAAMASQNR